MDLFKQPKVLIDIMCENSKEMLLNIKVDFESVGEMSYEGKEIDLICLEIVKKCEEDKLILVTSDKALIVDERVKNLIVYRGRKKLMTGLKKFMRRG